MNLSLLYIGDIMGKPGRKAVQALLPEIKKAYNIDVCIANAENLSHGKGVSQSTLAEIMDAGVDFCTSGNHIWAKPEGVAIISQENPPVIRPANFPPGVPGIGKKIITIGKSSLLVINLMGRVFMKENLDCPFRTLDAILTEYHDTPLAGIVVDFHAETTSEKNALGLYADGRISALVGTHTHVPTADERILPKGTGYITDLGMTGIENSVIGVNYDSAVGGYLTQMPQKFDIAESGEVVFNALHITIDTETGKTIALARIQKRTIV